MERLKPEIVEQIQNDGVLFGKVAEALGIKPVSLPQTLAANSSRLTQIGVIRVLRQHLGKKDNDLLEEIQEPEKQTAA